MLNNNHKAISKKSTHQAKATATNFHWVYTSLPSCSIFRFYIAVPLDGWDTFSYFILVPMVVSNRSGSPGEILLALFLLFQISLPELFETKRTEALPLFVGTYLTVSRAEIRSGRKAWLFYFMLTFLSRFISHQNLFSFCNASRHSKNRVCNQKNRGIKMPLFSQIFVR